MKFKPSFVVQHLRSAHFVLDYFNGRFLFSLDAMTLKRLLDTNNDAGERFNCVVQVIVPPHNVDQLRRIMLDSPNGSLGALGERLHEDNGTIVLNYNPQMAVLFVEEVLEATGMLRPVQTVGDIPAIIFVDKEVIPPDGKSGFDLIYTFDANWKGAEILEEICRKSNKSDIQDLGDQLQELMVDLKARRQSWEEDEEPAPRGYVS